MATFGPRPVAGRCAMVFELDLGAIRSAAAKRESNHWLMANPANVANLANENQPNSPKSPEALAKLAGLATLAISHGLETPSKPLESVATVASVASSQRLETAANDPAHNLQKPEAEHQPATLAPGTTPEAAAQTRPPPTPPAYDPGHAALLALAMAYCDRTGASDKARAQWMQDVEDTPPELRGDLYQHLREQLPPAPPAPPAPHPAPAPKPMGWLHMGQPWRAADRLYQNHHWQCPECKAAARAAPGTAERCTEGQRLHDEYTAQAAAA